MIAGVKGPMANINLFREQQPRFGKTYFHWTSDVSFKSISDIESSVSVKFTPISDGYISNLWVIQIEIRSD